MRMLYAQYVISGDVQKTFGALSAVSSEPKHPIHLPQLWPLAAPVPLVSDAHTVRHPVVEGIPVKQELTIKSVSIAVTSEAFYFFLLLLNSNSSLISSFVLLLLQRPHLLLCSPQLSFWAARRPSSPMSRPQPPSMGSLLSFFVLGVQALQHCVQRVYRSYVDMRHLHALAAPS